MMELMRVEGMWPFNEARRVCHRATASLTSVCTVFHGCFWFIS